MRNITMLMLAAVLWAAPGCRGAKPTVPPARESPIEAPAGELDVNPAQAAREVLSTVPLNGRLRMVKDSGALRVGLPPDREPFQSQHPDLGRPVGFNVALAEQMAKTLGVEAAVSFIPEGRTAGSWHDDFDIVIQEPGMSLCGKEQAIPYFMVSGTRRWLTLCVAHADPALDQAVRNTLDWFVETGVFTYLYTEYFP